MKIEKEASGLENQKEFLYFTNSCRNGIRQILNLSLKPKKILIPSYVGLSLVEGSGILDPIKETKTEFDFYEVDDNLDPKLSSLKTKIDHFVPSHVLLVNYFGFLMSNRDSVFNLLSSFPICVIEDFAHLLKPLRNRGEIAMKANFEVFSIHKIIESGVGGGALISEKKNNRLEDTILQVSMLSYSKSNIEYISESRLRNYKHLKNRIKGICDEVFSPFFEDGREPVIPLNYPLKLRNQKLRHELYDYLINNDIQPTALYHRLVPEISLAEFPTSIKISNTILNLPVHQDLGLKEMDHMVSVVRSFCRGK